MNRLLYLAGPLDGLDIDGTAWYDDFEAVRPKDIVGFMPGRAYLGVNRNSAWVVERANKAIIRESFGIVANLSGPGRALGTIREIEFAASLGKPVFAVGALDDSLAAHDLIVAPDLPAAAERLSRATRL